MNTVKYVLFNNKCKILLREIKDLNKQRAYMGKEVACHFSKMLTAIKPSFTAAPLMVHPEGIPLRVEKKKQDTGPKQLRCLSEEYLRCLSK